MLRARKKKEVQCKPNVIPILDAVFIFIFFLLMSAQFLEIHEIGSDAPAVKTISEDNKNDRPPLNLVLVIGQKNLTIKTGVEAKTLKTIKRGTETTKTTLQQTLLELKKKHPKEVSIILKPHKRVDFKSIVALMDDVRAYQRAPANVQGQKRHFEPTTLFNQVIFETIR